MTSNSVLHENRITAVQRGLSAQGAAAVVIGLTTNLRYLVGFTDEQGERPLLLIVPRTGKPTMIVPALYADQVQSHSPPAFLRIWSDGEDPMIELRAVADGLLREDGLILIDDALRAAFVLPLQEAFSARRFGLASTVLTALRLNKETREAAAMRKAGEIADQALEVALGEPILGATELQLAARLESAMLGLGAEGVAFETLVASGPNSALPHYRAGKRAIGLGDVVILDFGCRWDGYCSDITRTVTCGRPGKDVTSAYEAVARAHDAAFDEVASGIPAEDVDRAARETLAAAGYGPAFTHRTGHGIGLDVHEPPYIVVGNRTELSKGMAFSIEPGVYFPGRFGLRLEDVVIVGERGAESMTQSPRDLRIVK